MKRVRLIVFAIRFWEFRARVLSCIFDLFMYFGNLVLWWRRKERGSVKKGAYWGLHYMLYG